MYKRAEKFIDYLLVLWGYKWNTLLWFLIIFSAVTHYMANNNLFLAFLNGFGVFGISYLGSVAFCEKHLK